MLHRTPELFWNLMSEFYGILPPNAKNDVDEDPDLVKDCEPVWTRFAAEFEDPRQIQLWTDKLLFAARNVLMLGQDATPDQIFAASSALLNASTASVEVRNRLRQ